MPITQECTGEVSARGTGGQLPSLTCEALQELGLPEDDYLVRLLAAVRSEEGKHGKPDSPTEMEDENRGAQLRRGLQAAARLIFWLRSKSNADDDRRLHKGETRALCHGDQAIPNTCYDIV